MMAFGALVAVAAIGVAALLDLIVFGATSLIRSIRTPLARSVKAAQAQMARTAAEVASRGGAVARQVVTTMEDINHSTKVPRRWARMP